MITDSYPELLISKSALQYNYDLLKSKCSPGTKMLIPVKADAYGCGLKKILPVLHENSPEYLGVANPLEGLNLRKMGWKGKILNLGGFFKENSSVFLQENITPSITDVWQISALQSEAKSQQKETDLHLKLDLGMGRIGLRSEHLEEVFALLNASPLLKVTGIFTHFPNADRTDIDSTNSIIREFKRLSEIIIKKLGLIRSEIILHSANSYAAVFYPESHFDMIRPGIMFYGYFQNYDDFKKYRHTLPLRPSLTLRARPISLRSLDKGETVSYGSTATISKDNYPLGVIPLGYADGIPTALSNKIEFQGKPLVGRVTMDQTVLGNVVNQDEFIEICGPNTSPLEYWAALSNRITYEILTGFGNRLRRTLGS